MMQLNLHDIGCDMYSSSPHKWLQAPKGSGYLYVREEVIDRVWNTIATEGWEDEKIRGRTLSADRARRMCRRCDGLRAAIQMANCDWYGHASRRGIASSADLHAGGDDEARR